MLPPWLCQPLIRLLPQHNSSDLEINEENKSKSHEKEVNFFNY